MHGHAHTHTYHPDTHLYMLAKLDLPFLCDNAAAAWQDVAEEDD